MGNNGRKRSERGVNRKSGRNIAENNRVKIRDEASGCFGTARRVKQECPLSHLLFNLLIADIEEEGS